MFVAVVFEILYQEQFKFKKCANSRFLGFHGFTELVLLRLGRLPKS